MIDEDDILLTKVPNFAKGKYQLKTIATIKGFSGPVVLIATYWLERSSTSTWLSPISVVSVEGFGLLEEGYLLLPIHMVHHI